MFPRIPVACEQSQTSKSRYFRFDFPLIISQNNFLKHNTKPNVNMMPLQTYYFEPSFLPSIPEEEDEYLRERPSFLSSSERLSLAPKCPRRSTDIDNLEFLPRVEVEDESVKEASLHSLTNTKAIRIDPMDLTNQGPRGESAEGGRLPTYTDVPVANSLTRKKIPRQTTWRNIYSTCKEKRKAAA
jgi:hypothetical protein